MAAEVKDEMTREQEPTRVMLSVEVQVYKPDVLMEYAERRVREAWGEGPIEPALTLPKAAMEALVISNENPEPEALGMEIIDYGAVDVAPGVSPTEARLTARLQELVEGLQVEVARLRKGEEEAAAQGRDLLGKALFGENADNLERLIEQARL